MIQRIHFDSNLHRQLKALRKAGGQKARAVEHAEAIFKKLPEHVLSVKWGESPISLIWLLKVRKERSYSLLDQALIPCIYLDLQVFYSRSPS